MSQPRMCGSGSPTLKLHTAGSLIHRCPRRGWMARCPVTQVGVAFLSRLADVSVEFKPLTSSREDKIVRTRAHVAKARAGCSSRASATDIGMDPTNRSWRKFGAKR